MRELLYVRQAARRDRWERWPGLERVPQGAHAVLTFDDGPDEDATPAVLDALDAIGGRATFFVLGEQVDRYPSLLREIVARGHEPAVHGYEHLRHDAVDSVQSRTDILRAVACIEDAIGATPKWFRPPYGRQSEGAELACQDAGLSPVYWSAWGLDWEPLKAQRIADHVCRDLTDGAIVLLHDSAHYALRASARPTADAIHLIGQAASERDLGLVALGEAVA